MARFDPNTYPDRLAFEAHARQIRAEEIGRVFSASAAWLNGWQHEAVSHLRKFAASVSEHSHRHSTH